MTDRMHMQKSKSNCYQIEFIHDGGILYEDYKNFGIGHINEHLAKYSMLGGSSIINVLEEEGIAYGASTGYSYISHSFRCFEQQLELVYEMIDSIKKCEYDITKKQYEDELLHIENEINNYSNYINLYKHHILKKIYYDLPEVSIAGDIENIDLLKRDFERANCLFKKYIDFNNYLLYVEKKDKFYIKELNLNYHKNRYMKTSNETNKIKHYYNNSLYIDTLVFPILGGYEFLYFNFFRTLLLDGFLSLYKKSFREEIVNSLQIIMTDFPSNNSLIIFIRHKDEKRRKRFLEDMINFLKFEQNIDSILKKITNHHDIYWSYPRISNYRAISLFQNRKERFDYTYENIANVMRSMKNMKLDVEEEVII